MNTLEWIALILGILARLFVPVGATAIVVWFLGRLDSRWQKEAIQQAANLGGTLIPIAQLHCWDVHDCSPERKATCQAYLNSETSCWEAHCQNGQLQQACQRCAFRKMKLVAL